jgi:hypothetical protein
VCRAKDTAAVCGNREVCCPSVVGFAVNAAGNTIHAASSLGH